MPYKTFGFTEEQILMRDNVLGLLERVLPPEKIAEQEKNSEYPTRRSRRSPKAAG